MPLQIRYVDDLACPTVICDHCGEAIQKASLGNFQWDSDAREPALVFTHKHCYAAFEAAHPHVDWGALGLECLPVYLACNLKINQKRAKAIAAFCAGYFTDGLV
jgi:hypothetical protein